MTTPKQNIIHHVCDTAMHILHDSYLSNTNLWPKRGFKAGWGIGCEVKDRIYYGANAYGWDQTPAFGSIVFNVWNTGIKRLDLQHYHIKLILDYAYRNDLLFEDERRKYRDDLQVKFKFTYTPKN